MKKIWSGIEYAVTCSFLIILIPTLINVLDILQSSRYGFNVFVYGRFHNLAGKLTCYSLLGCSKLGYGIFALEWIICTAIVYGLSRRHFTNTADRKKLIVEFAILFPIVNTFFSYVVMVFITFFVESLKFGFV